VAARGLGIASVIAIFMAVSSTLSAQWPSYPTPGVPRGADGKVVMDAPTPRTPDGKVDFSGIWMGGRAGGGGAARGRGAAPAAATPDGTPGGGGGAARGGGAAPPAATPDGTPGGGGGAARGRGAAPPATTPDGIPISNFGEVAGRGYQLPLQPWAAELKKKRMADNMKDNPDVWCLPIGLMQFHNHPQPRQIVQTKNLMLITYESNYGLRYIYMDGRPAPDNDPTPWWYGYSRGWYEGDTLVVETTNFRGDERAGWLDVNGSPYSDALKMTERFRRPNFGTLEIDITIDDPKAYTKPFTVRVNQRIMVDEEMIEFICNENEQSSKHVGK
jgi:hypothetical protein